MGQTHNRRRTRSRPRSRAVQYYSLYNTPWVTGDTPSRSALSFHPSSLPPQMVKRADRGPAPYDSSLARRQIFGSDSGDEEGELCGPMLRVVWRLWGGFDFDDDA